MCGIFNSIDSEKMLKKEKKRKKVETQREDEL